MENLVLNRFVGNIYGIIYVIFLDLLLNEKIINNRNEYVGHYLTGYIKYILRALDKKKIKIYILTSKETLKNGKGL